MLLHGPDLKLRAIRPSGAASTLLTGLVSWWKMDEESGTRADEVGSNDLTDNNTVGFAAGKIGNAASFVHGNSECLNVDSGAGNEVWNCSGGTWTISCWVWFDKTTVDSTELVFSADNGTTPQYAVRIGVTDVPRISLTVNSSAGGQATSLSVGAEGVVDKSWNHVVAWMAGDGKLHGVCNLGTEDETAAITGDPRPARRIGFGARPAADSGYQTCKVDLTGLWNRVLTSDERTTLYNSGDGITYPFTGT